MKHAPRALNKYARQGPRVGEGRLGAVNDDVDVIEDGDAAAGERPHLQRHGAGLNAQWVRKKQSGRISIYSLAHSLTTLTHLLVRH